MTAQLWPTSKSHRGGRFLPCNNFPLGDGRRPPYPPQCHPVIPSPPTRIDFRPDVSASPGCIASTVVFRRGPFLELLTLAIGISKLEDLTLPDSLMSFNHLQARLMNSHLPRAW